MGDGIHIIGVNELPQITIGDTLFIKTLSIISNLSPYNRTIIFVRPGPAIGSLFTELITGVEGITFAHLGSSTRPPGKTA